MNKPLDLKKYRAIVTLLFVSGDSHDAMRGDWRGSLQPALTVHTGTLIYPTHLIGKEWIWEMKGQPTPIGGDPDDAASPQAASRLLGNISNIIVEDIAKGFRVV